MKRLLSLLLLLCFVTEAWAEETVEAPSEVEGVARTEVVFWEITAKEDTTVRAFRTALRDALAGEAGRHLLDDAAFTAFVTNTSPTIPPCLMGLESCASASTLAFDMLGLSLLISVEINSTLDASYVLVDGRGEEVRRSDVKAENVRGLAFAVIRDVFDATGTVNFSSIPEGATIEIDGAAAGSTPFVARLPVGTHEYVMRLSRYQPVQGSFTVRSGLSEQVHVPFKEMPGTLLISEAPPGARVFIDGQLAGEAGQPITLEPGTYTVEVRAEGYETFRDAAQISPGGELRKTTPLARESGFLKDFGSEAIYVNNYMFRLGFEHGFQTLTHQDARGEDYELRSFLDENGDFPIVGARQERISSNGARFDFSYMFKDFGLTLLSLSFRTSSPDLPVVLTTPEGTTLEGTLASVSRLQIRPFQVAYRHVYKNVMPFADIGVGIDLQWLEVETTRADSLEPISLTQTDAFATLGLGAQYFLTPRFFGLFRYSLQTYFEDSHQTEHLLYLGVGAAFPNIFGIDVEPPVKL